MAARNLSLKDNIEFLESFVLEENPLNGLNFRGLYIPEEIMLNIFVNLSPHDILRCSLVCKNWFNIAKSNALWQMKYNKMEYPKTAKNLPWYVFYSYFTTDNFKNLIKNGNGEAEFNYWKIFLNGGNKFTVEREPSGSDPLPEGVPEFNGHTSCFATSYDSCIKYQKIELERKKLLRYIIRKYRPTLYASEWYAGRFDCASVYKLTVICGTVDNKWDPLCLHALIPRYQGAHYQRAVPTTDNFKSVEGNVEQWAGKTWEKLEILYEDYPEDVTAICFCHEGKDLQFWAGHYGTKIAGGVLKFMFDSIEPAAEDVIDGEVITM